MIDVEALREACTERLRFASERQEQLHVEIRDWRRTYPFDLRPEIDADGQGWTSSLRVKSQPPLVRWGMQVTEILNHLRSALNTTLSRIVTAVGITLSKPLSLQYPFAPSYAKWQQSEGRRVSELPDAVQRLIFFSQPFYQDVMTGDDPGSDWLTQLFRMDNQGKHDVELVAAAGPSQFDGKMHAILRDAPSTRPTFPRTVHPAVWEDGALFIEERTAPFHVLAVDGEFDWFMNIVVKSAKSGQLDVEEQLTETHNIVALTINLMIEAAAGNMDLSSWAEPGDPNWANYARPVHRTAFARSLPEGHQPQQRLADMLWAPHIDASA
jgi:hypothetical protein